MNGYAFSSLVRKCVNLEDVSVPETSLEQMHRGIIPRLFCFKSRFVFKALCSLKNLRSVTFNNLRSPIATQWAFKWLKDLQTLRFKGCFGLDDKRCRKLKRSDTYPITGLEVENPSFTSNGLDNLLQAFPKLTCLSLANWIEDTPHSFDKFHLRHLTFHYSSFPYSSLINASPYLRSLTIVQPTNCETSLQELITLNDLERLVLSQGQISSGTLTAFHINDLTKLEEIEVSGICDNKPSYLTDQILISLPDTKLSKINLAFNKMLTGSGLIYVLNKFPELESIDFTGCYLEMSSVNEIPELESLHNLSVRNLSTISELSLTLMINKCPNLEVLDLRGINSLSSTFFERLSKHTKLQKVLIDEALADELTKIAPYLEVTAG